METFPLIRGDNSIGVRRERKERSRDRKWGGRGKHLEKGKVCKCVSAVCVTLYMHQIDLTNTSSLISIISVCWFVWNSFSLFPAVSYCFTFSAISFCWTLLDTWKSRSLFSFFLAVFLSLILSPYFFLSHYCNLLLSILLSFPASTSLKTPTSSFHHVAFPLLLTFPSCFWYCLLLLAFLFPSQPSSHPPCLPLYGRSVCVSIFVQYKHCPGGRWSCVDDVLR